MTNKQIREYIRNGREAEVDPIELQMFLENEAARPNYVDVQGFRDLYGSVCLRAVDDYHSALGGVGYDKHSAEQVLRETGEFFDSDFFRRVTGINHGETVREEVRKRKEAKQK